MIMRLTLDEYQDIRAQVEHLEREITVSLADSQLGGLCVLDGDARIAEIRSKMRKRRPIMRRKRIKKLNDEVNPQLVYSTEHECWVPL